ncbi:hypothetical protein DID88_009109 [Monilinia fructigena]|uniref:LisH domain-containing protein n=1 Tax=Monilinia fructigena TaxID=38457 RepID=A0A395IK77_9HELO|nr:hypothetical protein DID88_009109 [Monilinia fructigena]
MTKETLTSDRVNFLIWKYLVESGYEDTACHLSKEWDIKQPEEELPFATHVGKHALVSVLNNGLLFDAYKREASRSFKQKYGLSQNVSDSPEMGVNCFEKHQLEEDSHSHSHSNSNLNGPPGKKPRLTNGYENGISNGISNGNGNGNTNSGGNYYESASTPMEIDGDQNGDGHAYPSPEQLPSPIIATNGPEKEAVWTSDEDFVVGGGDLLMAFRISDGVITFERKFETREDHQLSKITYDPISRLLATGSENGVIDIWDEQGHSRTFNAHTGLITSLLWQPLQPPHVVNETSERLLASSSEDGAITTQSPDEDEHVLSWDAHGQKLAYGCSSVLAVINFSR